MTNKRSSLGISLFLLLDLGVDDVVLEDGRVLDPGSPVAVLEPEAVLHVGGHAQVALVRRNQNLKRTLVLVLLVLVTTMTEWGVLSVARFCYVFPSESRGPAWAVGS